MPTLADLPLPSTNEYPYNLNGDQSKARAMAAAARAGDSAMAEKLKNLGLDKDGNLLSDPKQNDIPPANFSDQLARERFEEQKRITKRQEDIEAEKNKKPDLSAVPQLTQAGLQQRGSGGGGGSRGGGGGKKKKGDEDVKIKGPEYDVGSRGLSLNGPNAPRGKWTDAPGVGDMIADQKAANEAGKKARDAAEAEAKAAREAEAEAKRRKEEEEERKKKEGGEGSDGSGGGVARNPKMTHAYGNKHAIMVRARGDLA